MWNPLDEGAFVFLVGSGFISAASSGASASLGMDVFSRGQRETRRRNSSQEGGVACPGDKLGTGQEVQCPHHDQCSCVPQCGRCGGGLLGAERVWKGQIPAGNPGLVRKMISRTQGCTSTGQTRQELAKEAMLDPCGISGMREGSGAGGAS